MMTRTQSIPDNTEAALIIDDRSDATLCFPIHSQMGLLNSRHSLRLCCPVRAAWSPVGDRGERVTEAGM